MKQIREQLFYVIRDRTFGEFSNDGLSDHEFYNFYIDSISMTSLREAAHSEALSTPPLVLDS
jgi:hypothetical protein